MIYRMLHYLPIFGDISRRLLDVAEFAPQLVVVRRDSQIVLSELWATPDSLPEVSELSEKNSKNMYSAKYGREKQCRLASPDLVSFLSLV